MNKTYWIQSIIYSGIATVVTLALLNVTTAQVRSSTNYQLQSDSINAGGGLSTSTSYIQESTVGEIATGPSNSATYALRAGYQQMQEVFLSLSSTGNVVMDTAIGGLTGGISNGSSTFTVTTDSPAGYRLTIEAENDPALQKGSDSIDDFDEGPVPDFSFVVAPGEARFGYTAEGVDVASTFWNNLGACDTGTFKQTAGACFVGLKISPYTIAEGTGSNHPSGATTTLTYILDVQSGAGVVAGVYTATSTVTALPL